MFMRSHYQVITIGGTTLDAFMTLDRDKSSCRFHSATNEICFNHGDKIRVERYDFQMGGNATNVAVGLSRLGIKATLCSELGDDEFSIKIRNSLAKENIDRIFITQKANTPTSFAVIINQNGDRTEFVQNVDREHQFQFADTSADYVYLTSMGRNWEMPYRHAVVFAKGNGSKLIFNPGSRQLLEGFETVQYVVRNADMLVINKGEGEYLLHGTKKTGTSNEHSYIKELLSSLQELGPSNIVMTNGEHGSFVLDGDGQHHYQEVFHGNVVERTGAGDAYTSGFLAALNYKLPIPQAMLWGAINSSSCVGHIGAEAGLLTRDEMEKLISK
jgi:sugar/nucleoside kinase (ribokinase family)